MIKEDLVLGDLVIINDYPKPRYAIVDKLVLEFNQDPKHELITSYVGVEVVQTKERISVHESNLCPIQVNYYHLLDLGLTVDDRNGIPLYNVGNITMSALEIPVQNGWPYRTGLCIVQDWDRWIDPMDYFKSNEGVRQHEVDFPRVGYLHLLIRELSKRGITYDIDKLMQPLP